MPKVKFMTQEKKSATAMSFRHSIPLLAIVQLLVMMGCQSDTVSPNAYGTWSFTGYVVDGSTKSPIGGASIEYTDNEGAAQAATTDSAGSFLIESLPFGERSFKFSYAAGASSASHTSKIVVISSLNESRSIEGVVGNVSMVVSLFPLTGHVSGTLSARLPRSARILPAAGVVVKLRYSDTALVNSTPVSFDALTDSKGHFSLSGIPLAQGASLLFNGKVIDGINYVIEPVDVSQLFAHGEVDLGSLFLSAKDSSNSDITLVKSNVLSDDGFGRPNIAVDQTLFYVLPIPPKAGTLGIMISGGRVPNVLVKVSEDTVFIDPAENFSYDTLVTVEITGLDTTGNQIHFVFDGTKQFRTEKGIYAMESNAWDRIGVSRRDFKPDDTLWVEFSTPLDSDVNKFVWSRSTADNNISAVGAQANAKAWVNADTLFVLPDQRLAVDYGETMGFKINVLSKDGKRSDTLDVIAQVIADTYYVRWTNTKDFLGNMRDDFGPFDSVVLVSNSPISEIRGLSSVTGKAVPPDLFLDNVKLRGDTIIYKPSLYLQPDSVYGIDFDILFADHNFRRNVLPVVWKTASNIQLLSVDNRKDGLYRPMLAIGDSFTVVFSEAIDTGSSSGVPFRVHMTDVNGQAIQSSVRWLPDSRTAVIHNIDTLPTADFDASPAYTEDALGTTAVKSVTFDLITAKGEKVFGFKPANGEIHLHTERGLCVTDANIINAHDHRVAVKRTETPVANWERNQGVILTFNREIDTAAILADTVNHYFMLTTGTDTVATALHFSHDAKTATVTPVAALAAETNYRIVIKGVPAKGIAGAAPINEHGGTFSGLALNNSLLDAVFRTKK
jgi:hypothetical protein